MRTRELLEIKLFNRNLIKGINAWTGSENKKTLDDNALGHTS